MNSQQFIIFLIKGAVCVLRENGRIQWHMLIVFESVPEPFACSYAK